MCKKTPDLLANVKTAVRRCAAFRDERDAALKTAAAALAQLEAIVDSDTATEAEVEAAEDEYEEKVDLLVKVDTALTADFEGMLAVIRTALTGAKPEDVRKA
jgi:hypothetical protein